MDWTHKLDDGRFLVMREPNTGDGKALIDYCNKVGGESDFLTFGRNEFWMSVAEEEAFILEMRQRGGDVFLMGNVAEELVSTLSLTRTYRKRLEHIGVLGISVLKSHWGLGMGRAMCETAIRLARERGVTKITLKGRTDNARAIGISEKLGFRREGIMTRAFLIGREYFSEAFMGMDL